MDSETEVNWNERLTIQVKCEQCGKEMFSKNMTLAAWCAYVDSFEIRGMGDWVCFDLRIEFSICDECYQKINRLYPDSALSF